MFVENFNECIFKLLIIELNSLNEMLDEQSWMN